MVDDLERHRVPTLNQPDGHAFLSRRHATLVILVVDESAVEPDPQGVVATQLKQGVLLMVKSGRIAKMVTLKPRK